ncbi:AAA family ATPase [Vibrio vulnificus]|uniref:ATP-dependent nuclease n=1 Tax=Vibrio vulnificus TaxID=672 RepID=UPI001CDBC16E|nr:AAA family ATPase [Vibrio vulnificus]MCA3958175.1 AAA family ATPase [Vibrio vulnificus]
MDSVNLKISNIKHIQSADLEIPLEKGVYGIVGTNGCGKSTVLLALAQLISRHHLSSIMQKEDYDASSFIEFEYNGQVDKWFCKKDNFWQCSSHPNSTKFNGMYEGSLFYGTRFNDSRKIDNLLAKGDIKQSDMVDSDQYIIEKMSFILHGNYDHYKKLKRIRNRRITQSLGLKNAPYFNEVNGNLISQYRMSSGECLLVSLLHFVYNSIVRKSLSKNNKILVLIDEIELALHPIAVSRLLDLLNELTKKNDNLVVILTTHSPEVIRKLKPSNLLKISNNLGAVSVESHCYPSYLIRDVYSHDGFDFLLLTEDNLAKAIVEKILLQDRLKDSKLVHIVPAGGWENVLTLQKELLMWNVLGLNKQIISILDGDIKGDVSEDYKDIKKLFLPVKSIEKYLHDVIINRTNPMVRKILNDKYFPIKSFDTLIMEFNEKFPKTPKQPDKKFYFKLKKDLENRGITEEMFIVNLVDDLLEHVDFSGLKGQLKSLLSKPAV